MNDFVNSEIYDSTNLPNIILSYVNDWKILNNLELLSCLRFDLSEFILYLSRSYNFRGFEIYTRDLVVYTELRELFTKINSLNQIYECRNVKSFRILLSISYL